MTRSRRIGPLRESVIRACSRPVRWATTDTVGRCFRGEADLAKARELLAVPCILEEFVPFDFEASVVLVSDGERVICFPVEAEYPQGRYSGSVHRAGGDAGPGAGADGVPEQAFSCATLGYRGILAIQYFVKGDEVYFNEMAPPQ